MLKSGKLLAIAGVLVLTAGLANAGGVFSPLQKAQPSKSPAVSGSRGLLDCSGAIEITLGDSYAGTTVGAPNNVGAYGCSTWDESGGEVVLHLFLAEPAMFEATLTPADACDLDLAVLDQCDEDAGCLIVVDSSVVTNVPVSGDFYFVVDGYEGAACGFTFDIVEVVPPPPTNACDVAVIQLCQDADLSGDTCDGRNDISAEECATYVEAGLEDWYQVTLNVDGAFDATVTSTADGALWVVDACKQPFVCLAYADDTLDGQAETISYTNTTGAIQTVYLVVDSWGADSCGTYTGTFVCTGGYVPTRSLSFGTVKALYR